ncbi:STN and carboxypeptidase regulatory-like domain-containing protein [Sphingobacterium sp. ML3W]|uniref:STN and carboxypeptidase regulatory-like domain-containing protein n=1 Tax=Sphingobacterium sp. ML3W TaxID=1538644 RepID=UPI00190F9EF1|nr:STN and carboxypeptidase regulatory-like domain-containing protein [Sphingobacterium sp. ML3W]
MKVFFLYLFLSLNVGAATYAQKFTLDKRNISINYVFKEIRKQTGYNTLIDVKLLDKIKPIDINVKNVSIQEALKAAIMHNGLTYAIIEKNIIISEEDKAPSKIDAIQQDFTVEGKVLDDKGLALPGVTIQIKDMPHRTVKADENGFFKVQVFKGSVLILSYMGFQSQNITIANQEKLTIIMTQNQAQLEEVVVTALGIKRSEKGLGYAIQKVSGGSNECC